MSIFSNILEDTEPLPVITIKRFPPQEIHLYSGTKPIEKAVTIKVFGYADDKKLYPVELTFEQFAQSGIHPWHIDLFEPNPIALSCDGRDLKFSPIKDISFAFRSADGTFIVAVHDGNEPYCITGEVKNAKDGWIIPEVKLLERSFADCLREYLEILFTAPEMPARLFVPKPADVVSLRGSEVFISHTELEQWKNSLLDVVVTPENRLAHFNHPVYCGSMFEKRQAKVALPEEICWVFEEFPSHEPVVWGKALRQMLKGDRITEVHVMLPNPEQLIDAVRQRLDCSICQDLEGAEKQAFERNGIRYILNRWLRGPSPLIHMNIEWGITSADGLYCTNANEICGSRITFSDIGSNIARFLVRCEANATTALEQRAKLKESMIEEGYEFQDFPSPD